MRYPNKIPAGEVSDALIALVDLPASFEQTLLDAAIPDNENVLEALLGKSKQGRDTLVLAGVSMSLR